MLVKSTRLHDTIPLSMQLMAGRTAQCYNIRKKRKGAFWEDRYHATAVDTAEYLIRCMLYIDLNMVRAGVVNHPNEWQECGFHEILNPKSQFRIIDHESLLQELNMSSLTELQKSYPRLLDEELSKERKLKSTMWTESIAVGSEGFVQEIYDKLNLNETKREIKSCAAGSFVMEPSVTYGINIKNTLLWDSQLNDVFRAKKVV